MKEHLREGVIETEIDEIPDGSLKQVMHTKDHQPLYVVNRMYERLQSLVKEGRISKENLWIIDQELKELMDIIGACERIKNTPIPYSYNMFIKKFIFIYSVTLPFGILNITHYWTVPIVTIIFYLLASTELIAEEIEDPFGRDENDLPTDNLAVKIKSNVQEALPVS
jgi:putative membrane protein